MLQSEKSGVEKGCTVQVYKYRLCSRVWKLAKSTKKSITTSMSRIDYCFADGGVMLALLVLASIK